MAKNLPDMSGIEVLSKLKEIDPDTAVLIITCHASLDSAIEAVGLGADDYVIKPSDDINAVVRRVTQAEERVRLTRNNQTLIEELEETVQALGTAKGQLEAAYVDTIDAVVRAVEAKDLYTGGHVDRVRRGDVPRAVETPAAARFTTTQPSATIRRARAARRAR